MRILVLGGTVFLGRHLVEALLARGHEVTLFHRGRHHPDLFADVERVLGDRVRDLDALRGRTWDAVVDTCGYTPSTVRKSAHLLADAVSLYVFVSSISVYEEFSPAGTSEETPVRSLTEEELKEAEGIDPGPRATAARYGAMYGPLKALCEETIEELMPGRVLRLRPGLIAGPYDYSDRLTYWVRRVAKGGRVLAPGRPGRRIRLIDVRDLAQWIVRSVEARRTGTYNATGPVEGSTMGQLLEECRRVSGSDARFTWVSEQFLDDHEVRAFSDLPLWLHEEYNGLFEVRNDKAVAAGLCFRGLTETIEDVLASTPSMSGAAEWKVGISPEREAELLRLADAWNRNAGRLPRSASPL